MFRRSLWMPELAVMGQLRLLPTTRKGLPSWLSSVSAIGVHLVAMEATGGYEEALRAAVGSRIQVAVVNPRAVRSFAQGMGLLEKTDRIDAGVIAWYADTKGCVAVSPASAQQQQLKAMVTRLRQLTELRTAPQSASAGDRQGGAEVLSQVAGSCAEADAEIWKWPSLG